MEVFILEAQRYFTKEQWNAFDKSDQLKYGQVLYIYYACTELGIPVVTPNFMLKQQSVEENLLVVRKTIISKCQYCETDFFSEEDSVKHMRLCKKRIASKEEAGTPTELKEVAFGSSEKLPAKSEKIYKKAFDIFLSWCDENNTRNITENVLLAYFTQMGEHKKSSTLWTNYSMIRSCLSIYYNMDITKYSKLQAFLKKQSENYTPKRSQVLEADSILKFIETADDTFYLAVKIILIVGYCGACRRHELTNMSINDIEFDSEFVKITIPKTKNNIVRVFFIKEQSWISLIKKYYNLRPLHATTHRFFLTYRNGSCTTCPMGINKIGAIPKIIAKYLNLENPETYTGHCFRRSSATQKATSEVHLM